MPYRLPGECQTAKPRPLAALRPGGETGPITPRPKVKLSLAQQHAPAVAAALKGTARGEASCHLGRQGPTWGTSTAPQGHHGGPRPVEVVLDLRGPPGGPGLCEVVPVLATCKGLKETPCWPLGALPASTRLLGVASGQASAICGRQLLLNSPCSCLTCSLGMAAASDPSRCPVQLAASREESCRALGSGCLAEEPCGAGGGPRAQPAPRRPWLRAMPGVCNRALDFLSPAEDQVLGPALGSSVALNCTAWVVSGHHCSLPSVQWLKDGLPLGNGGHYSLHEHSWFKANLSEGFVSSVLGVNVTSAEDYGAFTCSIQNVSSSSFTLQRAGDGGSLGRGLEGTSRPGSSWRGGGSGNPLAGLASHVAAVLASLLVLLALLLAAVLYVKCRLNVLLWYQDAYAEVEMNDGKLYDAYVSYSDCLEDRKFVNFILKPQLERRRGYKLFLDDRDLLPRAEPSADLLVNLSRCRRLIVVLSDAFLSRAWCNHSFREGLCRLLELTRRPIFITFEGQRRDPAHPALRLLRQHRHLVTLLLWRPGSVTPSSDFWKELQLALPRKVHYRPVEGDPQMQLQDDKDPMLILQGRVREGRALDEGDLGVPGSVFGAPSAPPSTGGVLLGEGRGSEVDVSDLGSRNYSARTDFYCLVSKDDM
ncbi:Single Ig IL-1-related receptor [Plecturocebus cupreus]